MFNNGDGGCGNDLAIDDIIFRSCGDLTSIDSGNSSNMNLKVCEEDTPISIDLKATQIILYIKLTHTSGNKVQIL